MHSNRTAGWIMILICIISIGGCLNMPGKINSSDSAAMSSMTMDLMQAKAVFVGEFHDQRDHHNLQLAIIRELHRQGAQLAIGLEMFDIEKQPVLDEWINGRMGLKEFAEKYSKGWSINWAEYDTIFLFARNNRIPLVALDAPPEIVRLVTHAGSKALGSAALQRLPTGVTTEISPSYRDFMEMAFNAHTSPGPMFDNFCAAQGLRNSTMALTISGYLKRNPERRMVVVAGVGHTMRRAAPRLLDGSGLPYRIVIPKVFGLYEELERSDMDYFISFD